MLQLSNNHSADYEGNTSKVTFAPLYSLLVRAAQLFICAAAFGGFYESNSNYILGPIIAVSTLMIFLPFLFRNGSCSIEAVTPLRSSGWACVLWTSIICAARYTYASRSPFLSSELSIYIGWIVIYAFGACLSVLIDISATRAWEHDIMSAGLGKVVDELLCICDDLLLDDAIIGTRGRGKQSARFREEIKRARSPAQLQQVLISLEKNILIWKLSREFQQGRSEWLRDSLEPVVSHYPEVGYGSGLVTTLSRTLEISPLNVELLPTDSRLADPSLQSSPQTDEAAPPVVAISVMSPELSLAVNKFKLLSSGVRRDSLSAVKVSRDVLSILLKRLPSDACWHIYSYCIDLLSVKRKLITAKSAGGHYLFRGAVLSTMHTPKTASFYDLLSWSQFDLSSKLLDIAPMEDNIKDENGQITSVSVSLDTYSPVV
jgi:hypothetical protein